MKHPEFELQKQVCRYLDLAYPKSLYMSDTIANVKLNMTQAVRNKSIQKQGFKCPDLIIFEPRGGYNGLFIELKVVSPFKKDGTLKKSEHLEGQQKTIIDLLDRGYYADFATGFDEAKKIIDMYLNEDFVHIDMNYSDLLKGNQILRKGIQTTIEIPTRFKASDFIHDLK